MFVKIIKYTVNISYVHGFTYCEINFVFDRKIKYLKFNLSPKVDLFVDAYCFRNNNKIKMYFQNYIDSIKMSVVFKLNDNSLVNFSDFIFLPVYDDNYSIKFIDIVSKDYQIGGDYKNGVLANLLIAFSKGKGCIKIVNNDIKKIYLPKCANVKEITLFYKCEIEKFLIYYTSIFHTKVSCNIIFNDIKISKALSSIDLIVISESLFRKSHKTTLFLYLFHELIHQMLGNTISFVGEQAMITCECLTEYTSLYYLEKRFNQKVFKNQINKHIFKCFNFEKQVSIQLNGFVNIDDYRFSRGIVLLYQFFRTCKKEKLLFQIFILKIIENNVCSKEILTQILLELSDTKFLR